MAVRRRFVAILLSCAAAGAAAAPAASAAEPVRRIGIEVQPYYQASRSPDGTPQVAVGKSYDALLSSNRREDILAARDRIVANPGRVSPMTLMVLAVRLYDAGLRDDAVFWFYVAKDRTVVFSDVVDTRRPNLAPAIDAVNSFSVLAGPVINGYAFCDLANQQALRAKALAWVEANTYEPVFMTQLPARSADRPAALAAAIGNVKANMAKERAYFADAKNAEAFAASRKRNETDAKFCWK